jgi:hypothetical protein
MVSPTYRYPSYCRSLIWGLSRVGSWTIAEMLRLLFTPADPAKHLTPNYQLGDARVA